MSERSTHGDDAFTKTVRRKPPLFALGSWPTVRVILETAPSFLNQNTETYGVVRG
jgi:hypothetical protein